jgi:hypothetical protein
MTQALEAASPESTEPKPLNHRQRAFARELGIAIAKGGRDDDLVEAYAAAGYARDRGNARRLAADPRVRAIADEACAETLRLAGLHIGYLQAKALELLHASTTRIHREMSKCLQADEYFPESDNPVVRFRIKEDLTPDQQAALDAATWPLSKFKIDKDGVISIELPDKKGIIEMLAKQLGVGKDEAGDVNVNVGLEALVVQSLTQPKEKAA